MNKIKTIFFRKNGKTVGSDIIYPNEMYDHPISKGQLPNSDISSLKVNYDKDSAATLAFDLIAETLVEVSGSKPKKKAKA